MLRQDEFVYFLVLLVLYEGRHCLMAMRDFSYARDGWRPVIRFFLPFYSVYLISLILIIRYSYNFARPFIERGETSSLFSAVIDALTPFLITSVLIAVLTNLFAHWLVNKDAIRPDEIVEDVPHEE